MTTQGQQTPFATLANVPFENEESPTPCDGLVTLRRLAPPPGFGGPTAPAPRHLAPPPGFDHITTAPTPRPLPPRHLPPPPGFGVAAAPAAPPHLTCAADPRVNAVRALLAEALATQRARLAAAAAEQQAQLEAVIAAQATQQEALAAALAAQQEAAAAQAAATAEAMAALQESVAHLAAQVEELRAAAEQKAAGSEQPPQAQGAPMRPTAECLEVPLALGSGSGSGSGSGTGSASRIGSGSPQKEQAADAWQRSALGSMCWTATTSSHSTEGEGPGARAYVVLRRRCTLDGVDAAQQAPLPAFNPLRAVMACFGAAAPESAPPSTIPAMGPSEDFRQWTHRANRDAIAAARAGKPAPQPQRTPSSKPRRRTLGQRWDGAWHKAGKMCRAAAARF
jgi:hypothetical protein